MYPAFIHCFHAKMMNLLMIRGGSGSDDPLDDGNEDKDYVFCEGYSERGKR